MGSAPTEITTTKTLGYESKELTTDITYKAAEDTKLTDLGVQTGYINVLKDGNIVASVAIEENTTVQQLFRALSAYNIAGNVDANGKISLESVGDVTVSDGTSDFVSKFGLDETTTKATYQGTTQVLEQNVNIATEETLVSYYNKPGQTSTGAVYVKLTNQYGEEINSVINIEDDDTFADLVQKFQEVGIDAKFENGVFSFHYGLGDVELTSDNSKITNLLQFHDANLEKWMQNDDCIDYQVDEIRYDSICNYADTNTNLGLLGVTDGELTIGINGANKRVMVEATDTIGSLISKISAATGGTVTASLTAEGKFMLEAAEGLELFFGTNSDTTNLAAIFNLNQNGTNIIDGQTSLYKVNAQSKITEAGLFRLGNVTEGTVTIGNAVFTITADTTIESFVNEINHSEDALANAYWDNINGKMVITSTSLGASYMNISGGTSNIAEIFGLVVKDGADEKLATYNQQLGKNAILTINGTRIVATSNTITSDISRIEGLTVNIKGITPGEYVTITVERNTDALIDAVKETLENYNTLIAQLNTSLSIGNDLHNDIALRSIKKEISQLFTSSSINGYNQFRNLSAIGISTDKASSALTSDIYSLYLDEDKFRNALEISEEDVKTLLVGTEDNPGILTKVEQIIESAMSATGYFNSKNNSLNRQIANIDKQIARAQQRTDSYKALLERKFSNMENMYSSMQASFNNLFSIM